MPTYDYVCDACGHAFEQFQTMSEKRLSTCPKCKKKKLVRQIGAGGGIIFKGSGFYQTDYKKTTAPASETASTTAPPPCGKEACAATPGTCAADDAPKSTPEPAAKPAASRKGDAKPATRSGTKRK